MFLVKFLFIFPMIKINCEEVKVTKPIINKCCSIDKYIIKYEIGFPKICRPLKGHNYTDVVIYNRKFMATTESLQTEFEIVPKKFLNSTFRDLAYDYKVLSPEINWYLTKEFGLVMAYPNVYDPYKQINSDIFCYDYTENEHNEIVPRFWVDLKDDPVPTNSDGLFNATVMLVSSVFLLLVLIVYALLPELRNLCGLILMAYVSSLLAAYVLLATMMITSFNSNMCIVLTCTTYFFLLSTYCWMNVMSYDIWWTFRGYAKARPIHRRGHLFKFMMYSIYAYGVPFAMTMFLRIINDVDLTHMPWFIKPNVPQLGCFLQDGQKLVYLYIPMMILILSNWIFYLMTAFNVWRLSRGTAVLDSAAAGTPAAHRTHRQRFLVYLKLSVVMGLNWVWEVMGYLLPSWNKNWSLSDIYNLLVGVIIFVIFVCKPKILKKLVKLFRSQSFKKWVPHSSTRSYDSSVDKTTSQDTHTIQVCVVPKGSVYIANKC